ncbi:MAG: SnoaL-like domain protein [bacterium ADurb.Bin431]|nr:MAG: SnoaL-like domain protein [bacterium ADurb.Bin431]HNY90270.1 nuclear transport factor 2 family protein [bacterium]HOC23821.1 nuclear transport factor 2 family protein [bacterium]HOH06846.1 nuclear transport factor 2 family protein [bacterium]
MNRWLTLVLMLGLLALGCSKSGPDPEIESVVRAYHAAFDARDLTALRAYCAKGMFWYTLNGKELNASQIADFFTPMLARWESLQTSLSGMEIRREGGLAVARYRSDLHITTNGKGSTMQNLYTTVLVREEGDWKVWQHHMTTSY